MVDGEFFDALAKVGSLIRKSSKSFGGMQVSVMSAESSLRTSWS